MTDLVTAAGQYATLEMLVQAARIVDDFAAWVDARKADGTLTEELLEAERIAALQRVVAASAEPVESRLARALIMVGGSSA
jgi:hypothetical protein